MQIIKHTLSAIEQYNSLIKNQMKVYIENNAGERKMMFDKELPNIEQFKQDVLQILENKSYAVEFVDLINKLYLLCEANSDLLIDGNTIDDQFTKEINKLCPDFEAFSLEIFQFIYYNIFNAVDDYQRPITYNGFENVNTKLPEYIFKDDRNIIWRLFDFTCQVTEAYLKQEQINFENRLSFADKSEIQTIVKQEKKLRLERIETLSTDFCDRNIVFNFLKNTLLVTQSDLYCYVLSNMLEGLNSTDYAKYIEFNYSAKYSWNFAKNTIDNHSDLIVLPKFGQLIKVLSDSLFLQYLESKYFVEKPVDEETPNQKITVDIDSEEEDYLIPIPILSLIHKRFNEELWKNITMKKFFEVFTTSINKVEEFEIIQITRFYYLLKKIWVNGANLSLFNSEKEWIVPFLEKYGLSHSSYTNQSVKNQSADINQEFIRSVDKILPKNELKD